MDNTKVIKFFPKSSDPGYEVEKMVNIMSREGFELLSFNIDGTHEATIVFKKAADA